MITCTKLRCSLGSQYGQVTAGEQDTCLFALCSARLSVGRARKGHEPKTRLG